MSDDLDALYAERMKIIASDQSGVTIAALPGATVLADSKRLHEVERRIEIAEVTMRANRLMQMIRDKESELAELREVLNDQFDTLRELGADLSESGPGCSPPPPRSA